MDAGASRPAQHAPAFVLRLAETAKSQPFEAPNSVLSHIPAALNVALASAFFTWLRDAQPIQAFYLLKPEDPNIIVAHPVTGE
jgi:hypothetical protein